MTTTTTTRSTNTDTANVKLPLALKRARLFWTMFITNVVFDALLAVCALGFGIKSGYEGHAVFDGSRLGEAVGYIFGGTTQFLAFIGVLALIGVALWGAQKLSKDQRHNALIGVLLGAFVLGGLTFKFLAIGANMIPLLVFVAFVAAQSSVAYTLIAIRPRANR